MTTIKHRSTLYAVMRHDFSGQDVLCAITATPEGADNLKGEYEQDFYDKGFSPDEIYFYTTASIFYDV